MSGFEFNKFVAALLVAAIVAMITGLVSEGVIRPAKLEAPAYAIAAEAKPAEIAAAPAAAEKPAPLTVAVLAKADAVAGEAQAKKCGACHSFEKGGANKVGPNLWGVIGRPRASVAGFTYSDTLKKLGGTWTPQEIAAFIYNPKAYAPGTKMGFAGLPKDTDRADVLAWLDKNTDTPVDLTKAP